MNDDARNGRDIDGGDSAPDAAPRVSIAERRQTRPRPLDFNAVFGFFIGALTLLAGIVVLAGVYFPPAAPEVQYTCGAVLLLLSAYRLTVTIIRRRSHDDTPDPEA